jgi:hypothetical protein
MECRQGERYSIQREKLINKMRRENPLRRITDIDHAQAILTASHRHTQTNYENLLDEGRDLAASGNIEKGEIKGWAREQLHRESI